MLQCIIKTVHKIENTRTYYFLHVLWVWLTLQFHNQITYFEKNKTKKNKTKKTIMSCLMIINITNFVKFYILFLCKKDSGILETASIVFTPSSIDFWENNMIIICLI